MAYGTSAFILSFDEFYGPQTMLIEDLLLIPSLRPKVRRVIKLNKIDRAKRSNNPFGLSKKDYKQLDWIYQSYIPNFHKLFPTT